MSNQSVQKESTATASSPNHSTVQHPAVYNNNGPTMLQLSIVALVLGTSASFVLYTKRADTLINSWKQINTTYMKNHPRKIGPPTKEQWEKLRPRFDKDEFI